MVSSPSDEWLNEIRVHAGMVWIVMDGLLPIVTRAGGQVDMERLLERASRRLHRGRPAAFYKIRWERQRGMLGRIFWRSAVTRYAAAVRKYVGQVRAETGLPIAVMASDFAARAVLEADLAPTLALLEGPLLSDEEMAYFQDVPHVVRWTRMARSMCAVEWPYWGMPFPMGELAGRDLRASTCRHGHLTTADVRW